MRYRLSIVKPLILLHSKTRLNRQWVKSLVETRYRQFTTLAMLQAFYFSLHLKLHVGDSSVLTVKLTCILVWPLIEKPAPVTLDTKLFTMRYYHRQVIPDTPIFYIYGECEPIHCSNQNSVCFLLYVLLWVKITCVTLTFCRRR